MADSEKRLLAVVIGVIILWVVLGGAAHRDRPAPVAPHTFTYFPMPPPTPRNATTCRIAGGVWGPDALGNESEFTGNCVI